MTWLSRRNWRKFIYGTRWWRSAILTCCEISLRCSTRWCPDWPWWTWPEFSDEACWLSCNGIGTSFGLLVTVCSSVWGFCAEPREDEVDEEAPPFFTRARAMAISPFVCRILERTSSATSISSSIWSTEHIFVISSSNPVKVVKVKVKLAFHPIFAQQL